MLYPINITVERKRRMQIIKEKLIDIKNKMRNQVIYFIFDRTNLGERIAVKLHI